MTLIDRRYALALALAGVAVTLFVLSPNASSQGVPGPIRIDVSAVPITTFEPRNPSRTRFGALEFRGGLVLSSNAKTFGGFSELHVDPDGSHFVSASDRGIWLRGRIVYRDGKPAGIADAEMAPMLGADGRSLISHGWFDSESLTERDGMLYVWFECVE